MSRSNKPRVGKYNKSAGGGHTYRDSLYTWAKRFGNRITRRRVKQALGDEKLQSEDDDTTLPEKRAEIFDRWSVD